MSSRFRTIALRLAAALFAATTNADAAATPQQQCQAGKAKTAGAYATCRQKAEAGLAIKGDAIKYGAALGKCGTKLTGAWQKAIDKAAKAGATCLDEPLAVGDFQTVIDTHVDDVTTALGGGGLIGCPANLATCSADLAACEAASDCGNGVVDARESCDGAALAGKTCASFGGSDLPGLGCTSECTWDFAGCAYGAGHCDWRLPTALELKGILLEPEAVMTCSAAPCIDPSFPGATGTGGYWAANTFTDNTFTAYYVRFDGGGVFPAQKIANRYARAVRGGL